jgi:hypothetical protein
LILFFKCIYIDNISVQLNDAKKYYADLDKDKKPFALDHCWNILKGEDKWKAKMAELVELEKLAASKKKQKTTKVSRPRDEGAGNDVEVIACDVGQTEPTRKRSDGIKKVHNYCQAFYVFYMYFFFMIKHLFLNLSVGKRKS